MPLAGSDVQFRRDTVRATTSLPPTSTSTITVKSGIADCAVHGTATHALLARELDSNYASDISACQLACELGSRCESWSFYPPTSSDDENCVFYTSYIRDTEKYLRVNATSSVVFSDKYPLDGSNFCFGNPSWGRAGRTTTASRTTSTTKNK
jgi:hypothetical protein